ncbi:3'(2'),5'-bisphosphate nucleotidase CysQ [Falsiroseomonas sp. HW251]|uniref:3'(2'),5'-bisphosphate nucleotidase CysQ n=1 Tax=Falsiroseomonas sp. HW251 TaxID=3390998 RepID=UPI003D322E15
MPDPAALLPRLVEIAAAAGARVMEVRSRPHVTGTKDDGSPLTEADIASEQVIAAGLARVAPDVAVVSEEDLSKPPPPPGVPFVLVDPLDGTREFLGATGEFTVNIALLIGNRPACGVVYAPAIGRIWTGVKGTGAATGELTPGQDPAAIAWRPIRARPRPSQGLVAVASRSHSDATTETFLMRLGVSERRSMGSSIKFCLVAEGLADVYPRFGETFEWDTAAGQAVLEAAGGKVETPEGAPFAYGKAPTFRNGPFIAWGAE